MIQSLSGIWLCVYMVVDQWIRFYMKRMVPILSVFIDVGQGRLDRSEFLRLKDSFTDRSESDRWGGQVTKPVKITFLAELAKKNLHAHYLECEIIYNIIIALRLRCVLLLLRIQCLSRTRGLTNKNGHTLWAARNLFIYTTLLTR